MATDIKNNPVKTIVTSTVLGASHPIASFAEAGHKINVDRRSADGGKQKGRVQVALSGVVPKMMIAEGKDPEADWFATIGADVTPAYTGAFPAPTVGVKTDLKPNFNTTNDETGLASVPFPVVLESYLADLGNPVNYREYSGKKKGTMVLVYAGAVLTYAIATGSLPESPWNLANATVITPVGTAIVSTSNAAGDFKPTTLAITAINAIDLPVIDSSDLADLSFDELYSEGENTLWRLNETAVITLDTGKYYLMWGTYDGTTVKWYDLGGTLLAITVA